MVEAISPLGAREEAENFLEESLAPFTFSISCTMEDKYEKRLRDFYCSQRGSLGVHCTYINSFHRKVMGSGAELAWCTLYVNSFHRKVMGSGVRGLYYGNIKVL